LRLPRFRFTVGRMMVVVAIVAVIFAGLAWARRAGTPWPGILLYGYLLVTPSLVVIPFYLPRKVVRAVPFLAAALLVCACTIPCMGMRHSRQPLGEVLIAMAIVWPTIWLLLGYLVHRWLIRPIAPTKYRNR
jgi:hypothetical protein